MKINVHLIPQSSANLIVGLEKNALGQDVLKIKVTAVPEDGKANQSLIKLLAKKLKIAQRDIKIIKGVTSRNKIVEIPDNQQILLDHIVRKDSNLIP